MNKMKLLSVFLLCVAIAALAIARTEVINVDINGYNDENYYEGGPGAYPGGDVWRVYYGGWGIAVGSATTENLGNWRRDANEPNVSSIYAAQVWIGDPGGTSGAAYHYYKWSSPSNPGLMNDGFIEDVNHPDNEPNIQFFGRAAYTGTYDIYVYGVNECNFTMSWIDVNEANAAGNFRKTETQYISGGYTGTFVLGQNYVVFEDVNILDSMNVSDRVILTYPDTLNALQLVKVDTAGEVVVPAAGADANVFIVATDWDVAGEYNNRASYDGGAAENQVYGPSEGTFTDANHPQYLGMPNVGMFDWWEYMEYDIDVQQAGRYELSMLFNTSAQNVDSISMMVDGRHVGRITDVPRDQSGDHLHEPIVDNRILVNLFPGEHAVGWKIDRLTGSVQTGYGIMGVYIRKKGDVEMPDCNAVTTYGYNYDADLNLDCVVDKKDLTILTDQWLNCNDPNQANCL